MRWRWVTSPGCSTGRVGTATPRPSRRYAEAGVPTAMVDLVGRVGRTEEAESLLRHACEAGEYRAGWQLQQLLRDTGRDEEADRFQRYGIEPGGRTARRP